MSAFFWPAQWAVEHAFWREVAARTLAGILTLIFLGVPAVLYAWRTETMTDAVAVPIFIGAAMCVGLILVYVVALLIVRAVTFSRTRRRIKKDKNFEGRIPSAAELARMSDSEKQQAQFSKTVLEVLRSDAGSWESRSMLTSLAALVFSVVASGIFFLNLAP